MQIVNSISALNIARSKLTDTVALVPTMGNLHEGHLALVRAAKRSASHVIVTIFVNPMQFGANEDLASYPRTMEQDIASLNDLQVDILFTPSVEMIYPEGIENHTRVEVPVLAHDYCGKNRPGHFTGVATIVQKLFNLTQPNVAVFGKKDYQQLAVIRKMVLDMGMPIDIVGLDTIREASGLALSSRNQYLSDEEKAQAAHLNRELTWTKEQLISGDRDYSYIINTAMDKLSAVGFTMDYFAIADKITLQSANESTAQFVVLAAGRIGKTRLIDNIDFDA